MPTITPQTQALITARQAESLEWMAEIASYYPPLAIAGLPPAPAVIRRCPRFAPARHCTPAPFALLQDWRGRIAELALTPAHRRIARGALYRPVLKQGHKLYAPTGQLLCTLSPTAPKALQDALFAACVAHQQKMQITL